MLKIAKKHRRRLLGPRHRENSEMAIHKPSFMDFMSLPPERIRDVPFYINVPFSLNIIIPEALKFPKIPWLSYAPRASRQTIIKYKSSKSIQIKSHSSMSQVKPTRNESIMRHSKLHILNFPEEIIDEIANHLSLRSRASLALTCSPLYVRFCHIFKERNFAVESDPKPWDLDVHGDDPSDRRQVILWLENDRWNYCSACLKLHLTSHSKSWPANIKSCLGGAFFIMINPLFGMPLRLLDVIELTLRLEKKDRHTEVNYESEHNCSFICCCFDTLVEKPWLSEVIYETFSGSQLTYKTTFYLENGALEWKNDIWDGQPPSECDQYTGILRMRSDLSDSCLGRNAPTRMFYGPPYFLSKYCRLPKSEKPSQYPSLRKIRMTPLPSWGISSVHAENQNGKY